jgi:NADH:ubiquinone oxidoreductase subunit K
MHPGLEHYLVLSALLFCFGVYGMLTRRNLVAMLLCVELVLNAGALNFVAFHRFLFQGPGRPVFPILIIAVAAAGGRRGAGHRHRALPPPAQPRRAGRPDALSG